MKINFETEKIDTPAWKCRELTANIDGKTARVIVNVYPNVRQVTISRLETPVKKRGIGTILLAKAAHELAKEMPEISDFNVVHQSITPNGIAHLKRIGLRKIANNNPEIRMNFDVYRTILTHKVKTLGIKLD